jgi:hypothetical protein
MATKPLQETIMRSEVVKLLNAGGSFDLEVVQADRRRGIAGKLKTLIKWMKVSEKMNADDRPGYIKKKWEQLKDAAKHVNKTVLLFDPSDRNAHPMTVHYRLIITFNGKRVING